jgi:hypothetical protein
LAPKFVNLLLEISKFGSGNFCNQNQKNSWTGEQNFCNQNQKKSWTGEQNDETETFIQGKKISPENFRFAPLSMKFAGGCRVVNSYE